MVTPIHYTHDITFTLHQVEYSSAYCLLYRIPTHAVDLHYTEYCAEYSPTQ